MSISSYDKDEFKEILRRIAIPIYEYFICWCLETRKTENNIAIPIYEYFIFYSLEAILNECAK